MCVPLEGSYEPSPWLPIADQVELYEQTDGREGADLEGKPCVILWTRGRHSGTVRKTPLMRVRDGDRYVVLPKADSELPICDRYGGRRGPGEYFALTSRTVPVPTKVGVTGEAFPARWPSDRACRCRGSAWL